VPSDDTTGSIGRFRAEWVVQDGPGLLRLAVRVPADHGQNGALVLRRREDPADVRVLEAGVAATEQGDLVQMPLRLADAGRALLGEGVCDTYLRLPDDEHRLASPQPAQQTWSPLLVAAGGTSIRVTPFTTIKGNLSLRVAELKPYAEVENVDAADGVLTLIGSVVGLAPLEAAAARLVARRRERRRD
jgi:hypothetical protein